MAGGGVRYRERMESAGMSRLAGAPCIGVDGRRNASRGWGAGGRRGTGPDSPGMPLGAVEVGTVVRPGRVRNRTKTEAEEKVKKPADGVRKKSPPARKAPARGRYVDEYAQPAC